MTDKRALEMTCGACGKKNEIDLPGLESVAKEEAEKVTDADLAERYRSAFALMVRRAVPESLQRLPLALVARMPDAQVVSVGRDVLTLMLTPSA